jgi:Ca2+-binding EF-hand superfamily protein
MLVRALSVTALALTLAAVALPASAARKDVANIFFSPSGEPFHGGDKDPYAVALWFAKADANKDGAISKAEFRADAMRFFTVIDLNKDGKIDAAEVRNYENKIAPEVLARSFYSGDVRGKEGPTDIQPHGDTRLGNVNTQTDVGQNRQGAGFFSFLDEPEPLTAADLDFNNKVTKDEWIAAANRRFGRLDPEGTGAIKLSDLPRTPIQVARDHL